MEGIIAIGCENASAESYEVLRDNTHMAATGKRTVLERAQEVLRELGRKATQDAVGKTAGGVKQGSVSKWHGGYPSIENAVTFSGNTGCCVQWLLTEEGPKWVKERIPDDLRELVALWPHLPDESKTRIAGTVRLERTTAFTGDPERRTAFEAKLATFAHPAAKSPASKLPKPRKPR